MTVRDKPNLDPEVRKKIARLMQLHQQTHPERIAKRWNITGEYVRQIWSNMPADEQAPTQDAIAALACHPLQAA